MYYTLVLNTSISLRKSATPPLSDLPSTTFFLLPILFCLYVKEPLYGPGQFSSQIDYGSDVI